MNGFITILAEAYQRVVDRYPGSTFYETQRMLAEQDGAPERIPEASSDEDQDW